MPHNNTWIPLFPLNTVLFPEGILPLKVFETRYIDMVRECMKQQTPFGIVLIRTGQETGAPAEPEEIGCFAHIAEWDMQTLGIILLRVIGGQRFRILETRTINDQRLEARIETIVADPATSVSDIHLSCATTLKIVIDNVEADSEAKHGKDFASPFGRPLQLDNAGWVANRWCEILPIPLKARQKLLELNDVESRLSIVHQYLQQHKLL